MVTIADSNRALPQRALSSPTSNANPDRRPGSPDPFCQHRLIVSRIRPPVVRADRTHSSGISQCEPEGCGLSAP